MTHGKALFRRIGGELRFVHQRQMYRIVGTKKGWVVIDEAGNQGEPWQRFEMLRVYLKHCRETDSPLELT